MATDNAPGREEIEQFARRVGLVNLTPEQLEELERAGGYASDLLTRLPRDFAVSEEPVHCFRATNEVSS